MTWSDPRLTTLTTGHRALDRGKFQRAFCGMQCIQCQTQTFFSGLKVLPSVYFSCCGNQKQNSLTLRSFLFLAVFKKFWWINSVALSTLLTLFINPPRAVWSTFLRWMDALHFASKSQPPFTVIIKLERARTFFNRMALGWINHGLIFIFGWTIPLNGAFVTFFEL